MCFSQLLAVDKSFSNLDMTVRQALANHTVLTCLISEIKVIVYFICFQTHCHQKTRPVPLCHRHESLYTVIVRLVQIRKLRMIVVEPGTKRAIGTLSLSDIFNFLLDPSTRKPRLSETTVCKKI